jgi:hypothetical protein
MELQHHGRQTESRKTNNCRVSQFLLRHRATQVNSYVVEPAGAL